MSAICDAAEKLMLDWLFTTASPTRPTAWFAGLHTAAPGDTATNEIATGSGYARQTVTFATASSPAGTTDNANALTFGPFSSAATISGISVWDGSTIGANTPLWAGTLATARTLIAGDSLIVSAGNLDVTLA